MKPNPEHGGTPPREPILIYRLGSLGDTVVALPCLHRIAASFPDAERIVLTNFPISAKAPAMEAVLGTSGLVHRYLAYPLSTRSVGELAALRRTLRATGARILVYLTPARGLKVAWRDVLFFKLCGIRRIVGAPLDADRQQNRRDAEGQIEPECKRLARNLVELGPIGLDDRHNWDLGLSATEVAAADAVLAGLPPERIAINMGCKVVTNDWGEANWSMFVGRLGTGAESGTGFRDHALIFIGAEEDAARATRVGALWPGPVLNLCGKVAPRISAAAMATCRLFVGHDSGPLHLAAAVGVPCVGLYGDNNQPRKWHPYGPGHRVIHEMRGVLAIEIDRVERLVRDALAAVPAGAPRHAPSSAMGAPS